MSEKSGKELRWRNTDKQFLRVPRIENRKPVFVSCEVRDQLDEIVRRLGGRRMSVSGLIDNLAQHHLKTYGDDIEHIGKQQGVYRITRYISGYSRKPCPNGAE